jgi:hypothetical protein
MTARFIALAAHYLRPSHAHHQPHDPEKWSSGFRTKIMRKKEGVERRKAHPAMAMPCEGTAAILAKDRSPSGAP